MSKGKPPIVRGAGGMAPIDLGLDQYNPSATNPSGDAPWSALQSQAFARVVDLLCEGEIEGLVDGDSSIFIDQTPLRNSNGSYNFTGVSYDFRSGTQDQTYLANNPAVAREISVGVEVDNGGDQLAHSVVRTVTDPDVNSVDIKILVPQLVLTDAKTGDTGGSKVTYQIDVQPNGGSYSTILVRDIIGKTTSRYETSVRIELSSGSAPYNIRVSRVTADSTTQFLVDAFFWESYTEIIEAKLRYPNSALVGIRFDAKQFQSVPSRYYDLKLLKVKIPSNYNPVTRVYSGTWDGTFNVAWTDNPAWVFYDLATNERYGLGTFIPESQVDKWALYGISQYCDELVDDGFGGKEPRFSCNMLISDRSDAYSVMQGLASVFRGMIYWAAGSVTVVQDSPVDAAQLFTRANVIDGKFVYQGAALQARHSVALVSWNDPSDFYKTKVEYVEDQAAIARYGIVQTDIVAVGCTSRGQANRLGRWLLYTEQNESEIVTFGTGLEGLLVRPGQVIKIADPVRAGARMGGRISSATASAITIDQDPTGSVAGNTLSVMMPDGTVQDRTVVSQVGRVLGIQPDFTAAPNSQSIWVLRSDAIEPQTYRVISIAEEEKSTFKITALRHNPDKFAAVEQGLILEPRSYTNLTGSPSSPTNLLIQESLYQSTTEVRAKITASWDPVTGATGYRVRWKKDNDNYVDMPEASFNAIDILDVQSGNYTVSVTAVSALGRQSAASVASKQILGKTAPPGDVLGFSMIPNAGTALLTWQRSTDLDVLVGGLVRIRHTPRIVGQAWSDAVDIIPSVPGTATSAVAPLVAGTYMAKFIDSTGHYSDNVAMIVTTVPDALALNVVSTITENPAFSGVLTDMILDPTVPGIALADTTLWDSLGLIDGVGPVDFPGQVVPSGTYDFAGSLDLGGVWPARIRGHIDLQAFDVGAVIDQRLELVDDWADIDDTNIPDVNAELYTRTTSDDPLVSPTWSDWKRISTGEYTARAFQFQLRCTTGSPTHDMFVKELQVVVDMADRVVNLGPVTSGAGSYAVSYGFDFHETPAIAITAVAMQTGDYYEISGEGTGGFNIVFKNASGTAVSRVFYVIAKGYGRKVA